MSWEDYTARRNALKTEIDKDRQACRDTDLAGASQTIEVGSDGFCIHRLADCSFVSMTLTQLVREHDCCCGDDPVSDNCGYRSGGSRGSCGGVKSLVGLHEAHHCL